MKFGKLLKEFQASCPPEFQATFISYKRLKRIISRCLASADSDLSAHQEHIFSILDEDLHAVNRLFLTVADHVVSQHTQGSWRFVKMLSHLLWPTGADSQEGFVKLAKQADWCRQYAKMNAIALRKILKKLDKRCNSRVGHAYLQECWKGSDVERGAILHSPLLADMKAAVTSLLLETSAQDFPQRPLLSQGSGTLALPADGRGNQGGTLAEAAAIAAESTLDDCLDSSEIAHQEIAGEHATGVGRWPSDEGWEEQAGSDGERRGLWSQRSGGHFILAALYSDREADAEGAAAVDPGQQCCGAERKALSVCITPQAASDGSIFFATDSYAEPRKGAAAAKALPSPHSSPPSVPASAATSHQQSRPSTMMGRTLSRIDIGGGDCAGSDITCPICLDVFFKPVGLACGHLFCQDCLLSALGVRSHLGGLHALLALVPPCEKCPQCRQPNVFRGALELRALSRLIQARYPREWKERDAEDRARLAEQSRIHQMEQDIEGTTGRLALLQLYYY